MAGEVLVVVDNEPEIWDDFQKCLPVGGIDECVPLGSKRDFDKRYRHSRKSDRLPAIFFVDLRMETQTSGMEILEFIRRSSRFKHIPVVIISSSDEEEDVLDAYLKGANFYLHKSEDPVELPNSVKSLLKVWTTTGKLPAKG